MQIYGLKNCDSCKKAKKALGASQIIDLRETPISDDLLDQAIQQFGDSLVNRSSTTWRGLSEQDRLLEIKPLLRAHPTVMKRPLIVMDDLTLRLGAKDLG